MSTAAAASKMPPVQSLKPKKSSSLDEWQWKIVENRFKEIKRQESKVRKRSGPPFVRKEGKEAKRNKIRAVGKAKSDYGHQAQTFSNERVFIFLKCNHITIVIEGTPLYDYDIT